MREEDPFAQAHPLWAANLPLSRIEIEAWRRIPRRDTFIVLYGEHAGSDLAPQAARTLADRLVRESRLMAKISHPAVITVHDVGREGDTIFIAMELIRGEKLRFSES